MKEIGFIGLGHMGEILLNSLIKFNGIQPNSVHVYNRTLSKAKKMQDMYTELNISTSLTELINSVEVIISCVPAIAQKEILCNMGDKDIHFICASSGIEIKDIERIYSGKITRIMPTIVSEIQEGYTLICHNHLVTSDDKIHINNMFNSITKSMVIEEAEFDLLTMITSCGPGIYASLMSTLSQIVGIQSNLSKRIIDDIILSTIKGTVTMLDKHYNSVEELISIVATKGGLTEVGVTIIEEELPAIYEKVITKALEHNKGRKDNIRTVLKSN